MPLQKQLPERMLAPMSFDRELPAADPSLQPLDYYLVHPTPEVGSKRRLERQVTGRQAVTMELALVVGLPVMVLVYQVLREVRPIRQPEVHLRPSLHLAEVLLAVQLEP